MWCDLLVWVSIILVLVFSILHWNYVFFLLVFFLGGQSIGNVFVNQRSSLCDSDIKKYGPNRRLQKRNLLDVGGQTTTLSSYFFGKLQPSDPNSLSSIFTYGLVKFKAFDKYNTKCRFLPNSRPKINSLLSWAQIKFKITRPACIIGEEFIIMAFFYRLFWRSHCLGHPNLKWPWTEKPKVWSVQVFFWA